MSAETFDPARKLNVVIIGHVDAGKSTMTGRLIYELGGIDERAKEKLEQAAAENNKAGFAFAYFMDTSKEERERGITIDCQTSSFRTTNYDYSITDAPGHADFITNMITGAGQADVAVLMVPADGNFEASIAKPSGMMAGGQTRQHANLANLLGIKQLVGGAYNEARFNEIRDEVSRMIDEAGFHSATVPIIPVSGWVGDNLTSPTENMPWYNGWSGRYGYTAKRKKKGFEIVGGTEIKGKTLVEALDNYMRIPDRDANGPLHLSVSGSRLIPGQGLVTMGRIEIGTIRKDDVVALARNGLSGKTFSIQMHHQDVDAGIAGFNVGIVVKFPKGTKPKQVKRGDLLYRPADYADKQELLPRRVKSFRAMIRVQNHPGDLKVGFCPQMCVRTGRCASRISEIHWVMGKRTAGQKLENPEFVRKHEMAEITFEPQGFLYCETFERSESYGRVAGLESKTLVFMGKIIDVEYA
ncbi:elongation factor 1 alpha long form [Thecamonas trahens ATCC 50062]|uniref:Elongation factor 1 alpha long form n=1 Tax=Thecamonas trahens ATCC 50062 TaxID=461836 RepID=A0A0L0DAI3_THETB|nr:elongation factor 1 alpha long form [Thecamonas trahens ATCC 50062]KNC48313.1 elongation factor 1 alpha long form [Thecamonas trahens ATCC 50062]|eukprot:XP_013758880.1 elongation factor 1 alpha long form [Thecamonas trahens ATCC 50062]